MTIEERRELYRGLGRKQGKTDALAMLAFPVAGTFPRGWYVPSTRDDREQWLTGYAEGVLSSLPSDSTRVEEATP